MTDHLITTTMQPGRVVQVNDQELLDLSRMGVVASRVPFSLDDVPAPFTISTSSETLEVNNDDEEESETDGGEAP